MLTDEKFLEETYVNNLYYLRTLREFCTRVELSLPPIYTAYIEKARNLAKRCEELGIELLKEANGNIPNEVLNQEIFATKYTLRLEELTNKLFGYNQNTSITQEEFNFQDGPIEVNNERLSFATRINNEALNIAKEFIEFSNDLAQKVKNQEVFTFYYNSLNDFTVYEVGVYISILDRLNTKSNLDPVYVTDYEYGFNRLMGGIATFIRGECDPIYTDIFNEANSFVLEYQNLIQEYENIVITPENQKNMTSNSLELAKRFKRFIENCIEDLLNKEIYFISPPITKDNALTDVNFFIYNLEENIKEN